MSSAHPQNRIIFAPQPYTPQGTPSIFLSGSIEDGPTPWQTRLSALLVAQPLTILNPHRPDWDASWVQDISDARFRTQVQWELDMMEAADVIAVYLAPGSQAPITLLELGLFARTGKLVVACPEGFWRRGNVQVVCARFGIEMLGSVEQLAEAVERKLAEVGERRVEDGEA